MTELSNSEVEEVSGGVKILKLAACLEFAVEFAKGFVEGVKEGYNA